MLGHVECIVQRRLFHERENGRPPAPAGVRLLSCVGRRKAPADVGVEMQSQSDLLEVVRALDAVGGLADLLDRRQQETDEHGNDGNDYQELDECERRTVLRANAYHGYLQLKCGCFCTVKELL